MPFLKQIMPMRKKAMLFSFSALAITSAGLSYHHWNKKQESHSASLWNVLDAYGFKQLEQKKALEKLMKKSGIIRPNQSFMEVFPKRDNKELLLNDFLSFVDWTQRHFTVRTGTQERWEVEPNRWMEENQKEVLEELNTLNLVGQIEPSFPRTDAVCVLGARMSTMVSRLEYTSELFSKDSLQAEYLVLLAGERRVTVGVDGTEAELSNLAKKYEVDLKNLTETHLMREAYSHSPIFNKLFTHVIDTPARDLPRPTTETTLQEFCLWLKANPAVKRVTFISSQPHVKYQEAIIREVLRREEMAVEFEVIGQKVTHIKIQELVGALGSQVWAQTPEVIAEIGITTQDQNILNAFKDLYGKQPLIYNRVESLLSQVEPSERARHSPGKKI